MDALTINEAAETTGWSPRMLRYIERMGLVEPPRSTGGYRLYGPGQLQRLRTLRGLLDDHGLALGEVGFARRMQHDDELRRTVEGWLEAEPSRPAHVPADDWLEWEQDKHERLVAEAARRATTATNTTETL